MTQAAPMGSSQRVGWIAAGITLVTAAALLWPAFLNGYPLLFNDSGVYIKNSATPPFHPARAIGYSLFLRFLSLGGTLWAAAAWQGLFTAALLGRAAWLLGGRRRLLSVGLCLATVVLLTSGPRYTAYLMADVFTAWLFLGAVVWLAAARQIDRWLAAAAVIVAILVHNSHLPIALACAGTTLAISLLLRRGALITAAALRRTAALTGVVLAALPASMAMNAAFTGRPVLLNGTSAFLVSRFVESGVTGATLDRYCPERSWDLCRHRELLDAHVGTNVHWFLFARDSPFPPIGSWRNPEHDEIVRHAFRCCLPRIVQTTIRSAVSHFFAIDSHHALDRAMTLTSEAAVAHYYPKDLFDVRSSRQNADEPVRVLLNPLPEKPLHVALLLAGVGLAASAWRRGDRPGVWLLLGCAWLLVVNSFVCAFATTLWPRLPGRVAWLLPYCVVLVACRALSGFDPSSDRGKGLS